MKIVLALVLASVSSFATAVPLAAAAKSSHEAPEPTPLPPRPSGDPFTTTVVTIVLVEGAKLVMNELVKLLFDKTRGAAIVVKVPGAEFSKSDDGTSLGYAEASGAVASFTGIWPNVAAAYAYSGAFGSEKVVPTGFGNFASLAQTTWKGQVDNKFCVDQGTIKCSELKPLAQGTLSVFSDYLPDPSLVASAEAAIYWTAPDISVGYDLPENGRGSAKIELTMDGETIFQGGVFGGREWAKFTGDLKSYKSNFVLGSGVLANDLDLSGVVVRQLDYASFYNNPIVSYEMGRSLSAEASGAVPEPGAWAMMIVGFGLVGGSIRHRRLALTHLT